MTNRPTNSVFWISASFALLKLAAPLTNVAAQKPVSTAEIALYQGTDREQILIQGAKENISSPEQKFKKNYLEAKCSVEELEQKLVDWEQLMRQLFMRKR
jgi:hypothetical protein